LHGNNLSTLHEHLPTDILPAELGGTGPAFNPGLWAEPVIHAAMKEAEVAAAAAAAAAIATKKGEKQQQNIDANTCVQKPTNLHNQSKTDDGLNILMNSDKTSLNGTCNPTKYHSGKTIRTDVELNIISKRSSNQEGTIEHATKIDEDNERFIHVERVDNENAINCSDDKTNQLKRNSDDLTFLDAEINSSEFEIIPSRSGSESSKDNSLDNRLEGKAFIIGITGINSETPSEETNLIT